MSLHRAFLWLGVGYVVAIGVVFVRGAGIPAALLTIPSWYLVGALTFALPEKWIASAVSWWGNLVALLLSASLNVCALYWLVRGVVKRQ